MNKKRERERERKKERKGEQRRMKKIQFITPSNLQKQHTPQQKKILKHNIFVPLGRITQNFIT